MTKSKKIKYAVGLMSGTSLDAMDGALISFQTGLKDIKLVHFQSKRFKSDLKKLILKNSYPNTTSIKELCDLNAYLSYLAASLVKDMSKKAGVKLANIEVLGYHGQTVQHLPEPHAFLDRQMTSTLQIGDGPTLAALTGVPVVNNFRTKDMANGGGGAPLVPFVHRILFEADRHKKSIHNLGGISNLTYISPKTVLGFDTGPANMLIDGLMGHLYNRAFDRDGATAKKGKVHEQLASKFLFNDFFLKPPPKSTGREEFGGPFIRQWLTYGSTHKIKKEDMIATATSFTAKTVVEAYKRFVLPHGLDEIVFCGGGAKNPYLVKLIRDQLHVPVTTTQEYGYDPHAIECIVFAVLGHLGFHRRTNQIAELTGAKKASSLGQICWPY